MTEKPPISSAAQPALERAQAHLDAGDLLAALTECDAALQAAPQSAEAYNLRGIILDELGRSGEASVAYQQALHLDPTLTDAAENLSELQAEQRRPWPLWKRIAAVAVPLLIVAAVVLTIRAVETRRGPDWRLTLNEYIAQRAQSGRT